MTLQPYSSLSQGFLLALFLHGAIASTVWNYLKKEQNPTPTHFLQVELNSLQAVNEANPKDETQLAPDRKPEASLPAKIRTKKSSEVETTKPQPQVLSSAQLFAYQQEVFEFLQKKLQNTARYTSLQNEGHRRETLLKISLLPNGDLEEVSILKTSGDREYDAITLKQVESLSGFPRFTDTLPSSKRLSFALPIRQSTRQH